MARQAGQIHTKRASSPRVRIMRRGLKGGRSIMQRVTEGVEKTTRRIGLKGGAAAIAGGAAGMAVGMTLGGIAGAAIARGARRAMLNKTMVTIADDAEETADELTKRAEHLKEAVKKIKAD